MSIRSRALFIFTTLTLLVAPIVATHAQASECAPRPRSLVSWWRGEGDAADALGRNPGAERGPVAYETGMVGQAFAFDRTGLIEAATAGMPTGNANRTVELWVQVDAQLSGESFFAGYGRYPVFGATYGLGRVGGGNAFFSQFGQAFIGPVIDTGRWYHVAVTNVGNRVRLYIDGTEVSVQAGTNTMSIETPATNTQFFIGRIEGQVGDSRKLNGLADEVSIYDQALSAEEIRAIFEAGEAGKCPDTTAVPVLLEPKFKGGKLTLESIGANIISGDVLEVSGGTLSDPEQFPLTLNKSGTKWIVKKSTRSVPGGLRLSDALPAGVAVTLVVRNPDGTVSAPLDFTR
jgi:hypothetical protein